MASALFGPADKRLASRKTMPTDPSGPVTITSACLTLAPTAAGIFCPPRSRWTAPLATLIWPTSSANAEVAEAIRPSVTPRHIATTGYEQDAMTLSRCQSGLAGPRRPRGAHL